MGWQNDPIIKSGDKKEWEKDAVVTSGEPPMRGTTGSFRGGASGTWDKPSGFKRGFLKDPLANIVQLVTESETANWIAPEWAKNKRAELAKEEQQYQQARGAEGIDWPRLAGQIANPVNLGIAALTKTPPGASLGYRAAMGGAGGGMMGLTAPIYGDMSRAESGAVGTAGGVLSAPLTGGAARVVKPKVDPNVALLRKEGVVPTVGQSMGGSWRAGEDRAMSFPITGDAISSARKEGLDQFQRAAYARALNPIGGKIPKDVGFEGMEQVHKQLSDAYDDLLPKLSFKPDKQFVQETTALRQLVSELDPADQSVYDNIIRKIKNLGTPQGNMSGESLKKAEAEIERELVKLAKDNSYGKQKVYDALLTYRESLRDGLERINPMHRNQLQKINEGWANYAIIRDAASSAQAAKNEGVFTPAQLATGVSRSAKRQGQARGKAKLSEGKALMQDLSNAGQQVLPSKYPDSGTAGRVLQNVVVNPVFGVPQALAGMTLGAAGSLPYLPGSRQALDLILNARPQGAGYLADTLRRYPALFAPVAPGLVSPIQNK